MIAAVKAMTILKDGRVLSVAKLVRIRQSTAHQMLVLSKQKLYTA